MSGIPVLSVGGDNVLSIGGDNVLEIDMSAASSTSTPISVQMITNFGDLRLLYNNNYGTQGYGYADLHLIGPVFDTSNNLATAVIVSLFTDRLADPSDPLPQGDDDRRGWWGDTYADNPGDLIGSRLWLLFRTKSDARLPLRAQSYIMEALQWLIDDGVVGAIDVKCFFLPGATGAVTQRRLGAIIKIYRNGTAPLNMEFSWVWQQIGAS